MLLPTVSQALGEREEMKKNPQIVKILHHVTLCVMFS